MGNTLWNVLLCSWAAGLAVPLGGVLASREKFSPSWLEDELRHSVIAFGGGLLLAAVALVLVPALKKKQAPALGAVLGFLCGMLSQYLIES
ncbi:MAG: hypothetical protein KDD51_16410 [Bdellovibrionales bacterium]|nr:hypothetical protein [Bdellovibrionales bacterium]MCB0418399.1 hypothetical protein [Bdellovibrionales bacterium]